MLVGSAEQGACFRVLETITLLRHRATWFLAEQWLHRAALFV